VVVLQKKGEIFSFSTFKINGHDPQVVRDLFHSNI
jgi:hypothetical protein